MKIFKTGIFKNQWMCWCVNTNKKQGFYPCNAEGNYERDLWGRGKYYACAKCGRIINPETLEVVGLTNGFALSSRELRQLILSFQQDRVAPVGVGLRRMLWRLNSRTYLPWSRAIR